MRAGVLWSLAFAVLAACDGGGGGTSDGSPDVPDAPTGVVDARSDAAAIDAPGIDAPTIDAATPDAPADAPIDASVDAAIDAMPDAPPVDPIRGFCGPIYPGGDVLMELGHGARIDVVRRWQGRILTRDVSGRWVLWNADNGAQIASGAHDPGLFIDMVWGTIVIQRTPNLIELRRNFDGQLGMTLAVPERFGIALDGSYVWTADGTALSVWYTSGVHAFTRAGDYSPAKILAYPKELRIADGPAGADRIELVRTSGGVSTTTPPFQGAFHSWFIDGNRFLTVEPGTSIVRAYSSIAILEYTMLLPTTDLVGHWQHLWTRTGSFPSVITIYPLGSTAPTAMFAADAVATDPMRLAFTTGAGGDVTITFLDLALDPFVETQVDAGPTNGADLLSIDMLGWTITYGGVVHDSFHPLRPYSCGAVLAIAGSGAGRVAVATETGRIFYFDVTSGTYELLRTVHVRIDPRRYFRRFLELSDDGSVLVTGARGRGDCGEDPSIRVLDMTTGATVHEWPCVRRDYADPQKLPLFDLAESGTRLLRLRTVTDLAGALAFSVGAGYWGTISPTGTRLVMRTGDIAAPGAVRGRIFETGALVAVVDGVNMGWIDDGRLLFQRFSSTGSYLDTEIRAATGGVIATLPLPELRPGTFERRFTTIDANRIYVPDHDAVYSLADGSELWSSTLVTGPAASRAPGDVAGPRIVSATDHRVVIESY